MDGSGEATSALGFNLPGLLAGDEIIVAVHCYGATEGVWDACIIPVGEGRHNVTIVISMTMYLDGNCWNCSKELQKRRFASRVGRHQCSMVLGS